MSTRRRGCGRRAPGADREGWRPPGARPLGSLAAALALLAGCGSEPPVEPLPVPVRLVLAASDTVTVSGGRLLFSAVALDRDGAPVDGGPITWSVTWPNRGQVTSAGVFTAGPAPGPQYVRAQLEEPPLAESVAVRVVPPGTLKWRWAAAELGGAMPANGGPALATDGTIYVLVDTGDWPDYPGTLVGLTPRGEVLWHTSLVQVEGCTGVAVVPGSGRLWLVGKRAYLLAPTGEVLWDTLPYTDPIIIPDMLAGAATTELLVGTMGERPIAFRAADHAFLWEGPYAAHVSWLVPPTITADGQRVLAKRTRDTLFVFDAADGTILQRFLDPDTGVDLRVWGRGTVPVGNRYYLPTQGRLAAYDTSGTLLWLTQDTGNGMTEPAVGPDGVLYVQNRTHGLGAVNPDGTLRWSQFYAQPRWPWLGGVALAEGGLIYAAAVDDFWAVSTDGDVLWKYRADSAGGPQPFIGSPVIATDGTVYTFTSTHVYAFWASAPPEPNSPWPMWRHDAQRTGWAR
jgi:outer membrane protein assembly factor BamB